VLVIDEIRGEKENPRNLIFPQKRKYPSVTFLEAIVEGDKGSVGRKGFNSLIMGKQILVGNERVVASEISQV
jgi:hypothetical protein